MKFAKLSVASACVLVVGCGGSSQTDEPVSPDSAVTLQQVERFDQAERVRWAQSDSTAPQMAVTTQTAVDASGSVGISGTVTDNKAVYSVNWTNDRGGSGRAALAGSATSATWSAAGIQLQMGSNTITLVAEDVAGNSTKTTSVISRSASNAAAPAPAPTAAAPATVAGGAKPAPVTRSVSCSNGSTVVQAAGYYASGTNWLLGSFMPQCPAGTTTSLVAAPVAVVAAPVAAPAAAPAPAPVAAPAPAPASVVGAVGALITTVVNSALVPVADLGLSGRLIRSTSAQPYKDAGGIGAFRTVCDYSHFNFDDALVYPGQPGKSHLHMYFGNSLANANSTSQSIQTTGNGSCRGGIVNRSAYWVPAMINTATGSPLLPGSEEEGMGIDVYYKTGYHGVRDADVKVIPKGLKMIAGNSKSTVAQSLVEYGCNDANRQGTIPSCNQGDWLYMHVFFPQCWDGVNLDSPDHKSHVVYATDGRGCANPAFPIALPEVSYVIKFRVGAAGTGAWRLSSDITGAPAGSSGHADYMFGWEDGIMESAIANIVNKGLSGGSDLVGDGRSIYR